MLFGKSHQYIRTRFCPCIAQFIRASSYFGQKLTDVRPLFCGLFSSRLLELDASARAASFGELHLEFAQATLTIFTVMIMCMHYELANTWTTYDCIHANIHTYIHKYSDFS